jgi:DNA-binding beta-propeller fold protein YncE
VTRRAPRRAAALALSALLLLLAPACSDDDADDDGGRPTSSSPSTAVATGAEALRRVALPGRPAAVALGGAGLWVADDDVGGGAGRVHLVSAASGELLAGVEVGPSPVALAAVTGGVWVVDAAGTITGVSDPAPAHGLTAAPPIVLVGALVDAVAGGGRLYVADIEGGVVHVVDADTGAPAAPPIAVPAGVVRLALAGDRLWVSGLEAEVTPVDVATGEVGPPVPVGAGPIRMASLDGVLWVANSDDDSLSRLHPVTGRPLGEPLPVGDAPITVAVDGDVLWVLEQDGPSVARLDARTGAMRAPRIDLPEGMRPRGLAVTPDGAWVVGVDPSLAVHLPSD